MSGSAWTSIATTEDDLAAWEEAYTAAEAYLLALGLRNRLLVAELVSRILRRAAARAAAGAAEPPAHLAMAETLEEVSSWTSQVLGQPLEHGRLAPRGRLALFLANMPGRWQRVFLAPPPWPEEFLAQMRQSYFDAAPRFAQLRMAPRPLEFTAIGSGAALWYETMGRSPILRKMSGIAFLAALLLALWFLLM